MALFEDPALRFPGLAPTFLQGVFRLLRLALGLIDGLARDRQAVGLHVEIARRGLVRPIGGRAASLPLRRLALPLGPGCGQAFLFFAPPFLPGRGQALFRLRVPGLSRLGQALLLLGPPLRLGPGEALTDFPGHNRLELRRAPFLVARARAVRLAQALRRVRLPGGPSLGQALLLLRPPGLLGIGETLFHFSLPSRFGLGQALLLPRLPGRLGLAQATRRVRLPGRVRRGQAFLLTGLRLAFALALGLGRCDLLLRLILPRRPGGREPGLFVLLPGLFGRGEARLLVLLPGRLGVREALLLLRPPGLLGIGEALFLFGLPSRFGLGQALRLFALPRVLRLGQAVLLLRPPGALQLADALFLLGFPGRLRGRLALLFPVLAGRLHGRDALLLLGLPGGLERLHAFLLLGPPGFLGLGQAPLRFGAPGGPGLGQAFLLLDAPGGLGLGQALLLLGGPGVLGLGQAFLLLRLPGRAGLGQTLFLFADPLRLGRGQALLLLALACGEHGRKAILLDGGKGLPGLRQALLELALPGGLGLGEALFLARAPRRARFAQAALQLGLPLGLRLGQLLARRARRVPPGRCRSSTRYGQVEQGDRARHVEAVGIEAQDTRGQGVVPTVAGRRNVMQVPQVLDAERPGVVPIVGAGREGSADRHAFDPDQHSAGQVPLGQLGLNVERHPGALAALRLDQLQHVVRHPGLLIIRSGSRRRPVRPLARRTGEPRPTVPHPPLRQACVLHHAALLQGLADDLGDRLIIVHEPQTQFVVLAPRHLGGQLADPLVAQYDRREAVRGFLRSHHRATRRDVHDDATDLLFAERQAPPPKHRRALEPPPIFVLLLCVHHCWRSAPLNPAPSMGRPTSHAPHHTFRHGTARPSRVRRSDTPRPLPVHRE